MCRLVLGYVGMYVEIFRFLFLRGWGWGRGKREEVSRISRRNSFYWGYCN